MKRKLTTFFTLAISVALLCGCGATVEIENDNDNSSSESVTNAPSGSASGEFFDGSDINTPGTLSECLSTGKIIAYEVEAVDKAKTPKKIYFFQDGKVTIIPGKEFGLTMGDFAKMSDDEIWTAYETVKAAYIESYTAEKIAAYKKSLEFEMEEPQWIIDTLQQSISNASSQSNDADFVLYALKDLLEFSHTDEDFERRWSVADKCSSGEMTLQEGCNFFLAEAAIILSETNEILAPLQAEFDAADAYPCPAIFCDMPFQLIVETDASGNKVQSESLLYPTMDYSISGNVPTKLYTTLTFAMGLTAEYQIYETTYNCIALSGSGRFCTRETMDIDTLESKNILVDPSSDEKNALFSEEVNGRYPQY